MNNSFDLVIAGAGFVGLSLAHALKKSTLRIALIDQGSLVLPTNTEHRLLGLSMPSIAWLKKIGLGEKLEPYLTSIQCIRFSYEGLFGSIEWHAKQIQAQRLGASINAKRLAQLFNEHPLTNITLFPNTHIKKVTDHETHYTIEAMRLSEEPLLIQSQQLIGADGAHSIIRKELGLIQKPLSEEPIEVFMCQVSFSSPLHHTAHQRIAPPYTIALLPYTSDSMIMIWSGSKSDIDHLRSLSFNNLSSFTQKRFGYRLGHLKINHILPSPYCIESFILDQAHHGTNCILIGNAAHTLSPVAAQGLNLALYEVSSIANALQTDQRFNAKLLAAAWKKEKQYAKQLTQGFGCISNPARPFILKAFLQAGLLLHSYGTPWTNLLIRKSLHSSSE